MLDCCFCEYRPATTLAKPSKGKIVRAEDAVGPLLRYMAKYPF